MVKNRYIDFLKGIAILCVIYGHCLQYGSGSFFLQDEVYWENPVMKTIYSFHMPLFIAISGYLFYFSLERNDTRACLKKRAKLLLPICGTWAFILLLHDTIAGSRFTLMHMVARLIWNFLTDFWFLWTVLFCVACTAAIEGFIFKKWGGGKISRLYSPIHYILCNTRYPLV